MKNERVLARWVRSEMYKEMTGHTKATLAKLRAELTEGEHWRRGYEGPNTFYYNHEAIDLMMDPVDNAL